MKKILFPTDFSTSSENAFIYALEFAAKLKAEIVVLHTYEVPIVVDNQLFPEMIMELYNSTELGEFDYFKDKIATLRSIAAHRKLEKIALSHLLLDGDLLLNIKKAVKKEAIDFVIMGTNGASGWQEFFLGSNAGAVITDCEVPVLSIPVESKYEKIETIGFTTCYNDKDVVALQKVLQVAKKMGATVKCLHVTTQDATVSNETISKFETNFKGAPVRFTILSGEDIKQTIKDFIIGEGVDMLAMLTYKRNFFQELFDHSMTQKLAYHLKTPLLALHE